MSILLLLPSFIVIPVWRAKSSVLDGSRSTLVEFKRIVQMIAEGHKQIKEQFATNLHLHLHGAATLESLSASDDQG